MALRDKATTSAPAPAAAPAAAPAPAPSSAMFESEDTGGTTVANEPEALKGTDVVVANQSAMALALKKPTGLDEAQNVIGIDMLETMGIGAFPRITVDQGGFSEDKTKELGKAIKIELLSWNYVTLITTGEKDNKEADKLIRNSYDHVNVTGEGCTVDEYIARLREQGYEKAGSKKYVEIYANLLWTSNGGAVAPEDVRMVQLSLSPQSVSQWQRYLLESRMKSAKGLPVPTEITIGSVRKTLNSNTFGIMNFGAKV